MNEWQKIWEEMKKNEKPCPYLEPSFVCTHNTQSNNTKHHTTYIYIPVFVVGTRELTHFFFQTGRIIYDFFLIMIATYVSNKTWS